MPKIAAFTLAAVLAGTVASAQSVPEAPAPAAATQTPDLLNAGVGAAFRAAIQESSETDWMAEGRACYSCPPRRVGRALWQTTAINGLYELANLIRGQVTARITPKTWWANMQQGWVWDLDDFGVNQIGHPYQGSNYFNAGRSNGLSFYESAAVTAFGSSTWEYFGETNYPSVNDFINTTMGGIALGEMFHRVGWLVRNTEESGSGRRWREIAATAIDPVTGMNRFLNGDVNRVGEKPRDLVPSHLSAQTSLGVGWRGTNDDPFSGSGNLFLETDAIYGQPDRGRSRTPYDAFAVRLRFGGGSPFSEARVRGRILGQPISDGKLQFSVIQSYNYQKNNAYATGSQSVEGSLGFRTNLSSNVDVWVLGWGGLTVLGAVDSLPVDLDERPEDEGKGDAGQGVSEGPRYYDYGPGSTVGVSALFSHRGRNFGSLTYEGRHLYSLDGVRANHFLQRTRLDVLVPLRRELGLGVSFDYFDRRTFFQDVDQTRKRFHYPEFRTYLTWGLS